MDVPIHVQLGGLYGAKQHSLLLLLCIHVIRKVAVQDKPHLSQTTVSCQRNCVRNYVSCVQLSRGFCRSLVGLVNTSSTEQHRERSRFAANPTHLPRLLLRQFALLAI